MGERHFAVMKKRNRRKQLIPSAPNQPLAMGTKEMDQPRWTDRTAIFVSVGALIVAVAGCVVADRQADIALEQARTAERTLRFARAEANESAGHTRQALSTSDRMARSAERQSILLAQSVDIASDSSQASASAARSAADQASAGRVVPFQNAIFQARLEAIRDYARASADLSTALHRAAIGVPAAAESPATLVKMTDEELLDAAAAARPAIDAWSNYIAATSAASAPWDLNTQKVIARAEASGRVAFECFRWLGAYVDGEAIPDEWWTRVRTEAANFCDGFKHEVKERRFDEDAELVLRAMTDKLRESDNQFVPGAGHDPLD